MTVIYVPIIHDEKTAPFPIENQYAHGDHVTQAGRLHMAATCAAEYVDDQNDPSQSVWPRWQVMEMDTTQPAATADVTGFAVCALVSALRGTASTISETKRVPPWWQEYDPSLAAWELADWDDADCDEESPEELRADFAARNYPREVI